jgi:hypothetical protein
VRCFGDDNEVLGQAARFICRIYILSIDTHALQWRCGATRARFCALWSTWRPAKTPLGYIGVQSCRSRGLLQFVLFFSLTGQSQRGTTRLRILTGDERFSCWAAPLSTKCSARRLVRKRHQPCIHQACADKCLNSTLSLHTS